jgi:hypothetical protein
MTVLRKTNTTAQKEIRQTPLQRHRWKLRKEPNPDVVSGEVLSGGRSVVSEIGDSRFASTAVDGYILISRW